MKCMPLFPSARSLGMFSHANLLVPSHSLRALLRLCFRPEHSLELIMVEWPTSGSRVRNVNSGPMVRRPCQKYPNGFQTVAIICLYLASAAYWPTNLNSPELGSDPFSRLIRQAFILRHVVHKLRIRSFLEPDYHNTQYLSQYFCLFHN